MSQPSCQLAKRSLEERAVLSLATLQSRNVLNTSGLPASNSSRRNVPSGQILIQQQ